MNIANHSQDNIVTPASQQLRSFIGIPVSYDLAQAIYQYYQAQLSSCYAQKALRWIKLENFHITLKFIAALDEALLPDLISKAQVLFSKEDNFTCTLKEPIWFPHPNRARLLALSVSSSGILPKLAIKADHLCQQYQVPKETKPFRPHLTLARLKKHTHTSKPLPMAFIQQLEVNEIKLFQSTVDREGSHYKVLSTFPFSGE